MGIGRHGDRIYSIASPDKPQEFKPKGLCCGFVKVKSRMVAGQNVDIKDNRRKLTATIVDDIRPDRTARRPISEML
jgi:aminomethyltransferase